MRGGMRQGGMAPLAEINVVPLVDVTLVLLIIFMVTTAFVKDQAKSVDAARELKLNLPYSAAAVSGGKASDVLIIAVDNQGRKYIGDEPVTTTELIARVKDSAAKNPNQSVRIDGDRNARYEDVVEVVELCQFEGLHQIGLHTANDRSGN